VTPLKAALVFYYFMHLKYEGTLLKAMVFVALATLVIFIGMLFFDISFR
jgi:cytochrome c oxidase subunit 4